MSVTVVQEEMVEAPADFEGLVHYGATCCTDEPKALCGAPLVDRLADHDPADANCVVCVEMGRNGWRCPACGERVT